MLARRAGSTQELLRSPARLRPAVGPCTAVLADAERPPCTTGDRCARRVAGDGESAARLHLGAQRQRAAVQVAVQERDAVELDRDALGFDTHADRGLRAARA